jgi:hypothetical protein
MSKYVLKETKEMCVIMESYTDLYGVDMLKIKTDAEEILEVLASDVVQFLQD